MARITIEEIRAELEQDKWKLISSEYKNLDEELIYECPEGHRIYGPWKNFRKKRICPICQKNELKNPATKILPKTKGSLRILALDQATRVTGYAIYENSKLLTYGIFEAAAADEIERDSQLKNWMLQQIENWQIDQVALEGIQYQNNLEVGVTTFETLARLQGILMEAIFEIGLPYKICHTATWRTHCGVRGKSRTDRKRSMQILVKNWFDISVSEDCADAIGIGKFASETIVIPPPKKKMESWL